MYRELYRWMLWMNRWMYGCMNAYSHAWMNRWIYGCIDESADGWMSRLHRHLKLRTEGSHARVHELWSIRFLNVTSANVVHFLPTFIHIIIQVYATMVANLVIVWFIFTNLLNMTRCCPVILYVLRNIITSAWNTCKITGQQRIMFNKIVTINHIITKFATFVLYTCMNMYTKCGKNGPHLQK